MLAGPTPGPVPWVGSRPRGGPCGEARGRRCSWTVDGRLAAVGCRYLPVYHRRPVRVHPRRVAFPQVKATFGGLFGTGAAGGPLTCRRYYRRPCSTTIIIGGHTCARLGTMTITAAERVPPTGRGPMSRYSMDEREAFVAMSRFVWQFATGPGTTCSRFWETSTSRQTADQRTRPRGTTGWPALSLRGGRRGRPGRRLGRLEPGQRRISARRHGRLDWCHDQAVDVTGAGDVRRTRAGDRRHRERPGPAAGAPAAPGAGLWLLIAHGRVVPVDRLVDDLWEVPSDGAVGAIRTFVADLRRALEPDRPPPAATPASCSPNPRGTRSADRPGRGGRGARFEAAVGEAGRLLAARPARAGPDRRGRGRSGSGADPRTRTAWGAVWAVAETNRLDELRLLAVERRAEALLALGSAGRGRRRPARPPRRPSAAGGRLAAARVGPLPRRPAGRGAGRAARRPVDAVVSALGVDPGARAAPAGGRHPGPGGTPHPHPRRCGRRGRCRSRGGGSVSPAGGDRSSDGTRSWRAAAARRRGRSPGGESANARPAQRGPGRRGVRPGRGGGTVQLVAEGWTTGMGRSPSVRRRPGLPGRGRRSPTRSPSGPDR